MKKIICMIFIMILLTGCQRADGEDLSSSDILTVISKDDYSDSQNDLVYHDYGSGISLTGDSTLTIHQLDLNLQDKTAMIYAINLKNNEVIKLCDYQPNQNISYAPDSDGVYQIIAEISDGTLMDLTPMAGIETSHSIDNGERFIPLR